MARRHLSYLYVYSIPNDVCTVTKSFESPRLQMSSFLTDPLSWFLLRILAFWQVPYSGGLAVTSLVDVGPLTRPLAVLQFSGLIAAGSPNFAAIGCFAALRSFGVGGNLPVDSAIFLEFLPGSHQYLLTILSVDWAIAQVIATLVAWPLLGNLTCQEDTVCRRPENMGWRYFVIAMGGISMIEFFIRFALFTIYESPKYLMGKVRDEDAVRIVHEVARWNGKTPNRE
jgi:MFS family permease